MDLPPPPPDPIFHTLPLSGDAETSDRIEDPVWFDVARRHPDARQTLRDLGVPEEIVIDALLMEQTRPRAWIEGEAVVAFLRGVNLNPDANPEDMVSLRVWMTRDRIITLRALRVMALEATVERVRTRQREVAPGRSGAAGAILIDLARGLTERLEQTLEEIDARVHDAERSSDEGAHPHLGPLRRKIVMIRRYVAPQRDVLAQLIAPRFANWFDDDDRERLRELESRQSRLVEDLDELRDRAQVLLEEAQSATSDRMARTNYLLTLVAALFLPLGFLTGLLGVNVGGIPGTNDSMAFWTLCGLLTLVVVTQLVIFRWRRWL